MLYLLLSSTSMEAVLRVKPPGLPRKPYTSMKTLLSFVSFVVGSCDFWFGVVSSSFWVRQFRRRFLRADVRLLILGRIFVFWVAIPMNYFRQFRRRLLRAESSQVKIYPPNDTQAEYTEQSATNAPLRSTDTQGAPCREQQAGRE